MRSLNLALLVLFTATAVLPATGCVREQTLQASPLERLFQSSRAELCAGSLADALRVVERPGYSWEADELERTFRWSISHSHDDCGSSVSGRAMWRATIEAWGRVGGETAGQSLVASLRVSHRQNPDPGRGNEALREETEAALRALAESAPQEGSVVNALLVWYASNGETCDVETHRDRVTAIVEASGEAGAFALAQHFPPSPDAPRCAPGWMLSEVLARTRPVVRQRVISQIATAEAFGDDLPSLLAAVDATTGPLQDALALEACSLAVATAEAAFEQQGGDPRDPVADSFSACAATPDGARRILELQRRLTSWLVDYGEAEEAWSTLASYPREDVDEGWLSEIGAAVVSSRIERGVVLEALELFEALAARVGEGHRNLVGVRNALRPALVEATGGALDGGRVAEARAALTAAVRLFGADEETRYLRVRTTTAEAAAAVEGGDCLDDDEMGRIRGELATSNDFAEAFFADDELLVEQLDDASRGFRSLSRQCRRRRR